MTSNALVDLKQVDSLPAYACQAPPEMQSRPLAGDVQQEGRIQILGAGKVEPQHRHHQSHDQHPVEGCPCCPACFHLAVCGQRNVLGC